MVTFISRPSSNSALGLTEGHEMRPQIFSALVTLTIFACPLDHYEMVCFLVCTVSHFLAERLQIICSNLIFAARWWAVMGRDSSVGIATRYGLDGSGIESQWGGRDFPIQSRPALGPTQPPVQWVPELSRG